MTTATECPWCAKAGVHRPESRCYMHCHGTDATNGQHDPAPWEISIPAGAEWAIDIGCKNAGCDTTGSIQVDPDEIQWE